MFKKSAVVLLGWALLSTSSVTTKAQTPEQQRDIDLHGRVTAAQHQDRKRVALMVDLLNRSDYDGYKKLCYEASLRPYIGMTQEEARASTWCFPSTIRKTTTASGEHVQEQYCAADGYCGFARSRFLYFDNGILTAIQE